MAVPVGAGWPRFATEDSSLSAFTPDAAAALAGPEWLRARRVAAAERFAGSPLPTSEEEVWRYGRVDELDIEQWVLGGAGTSVSDGAGLAELGVYAGLLADAPDPEDVLGSVVGEEPTDVFGLANDAFAAAPFLIRVPARVRVPEPITVVHQLAGDDAAVFPRLVVQAGEGSDVTVVERFASDAAPLLVVPVTEIDAGARANVNHVTVQNLGPTTWQLGSQVSRAGQEATFTSATAGLGGQYARLRTDCRLEGRGATGNLLAVYFGQDDQTLDFRTFQDHRAPDTTSDLLFKGAVGGHSRSVYTGLIKVRKEARGTNAFQTNRNIKLSDHAWAESVPNLEIENNEVSCSHASAVGPIDSEQRFYLESRGVRPDLAERLVVAGFFDEVLDRFPTSDAGRVIRDRIAAKLDREVGS